jgi:hypothetical protein
MRAGVWLGRHETVVLARHLIQGRQKAEEKRRTLTVAVVGTAQQHKGLLFCKVY